MTPFPSSSNSGPSGRFDLLIIGGGIVGAGIARDAAMRGLRVGLVEQHDFASGTSSRSSRLLHGGLRYLAQGRLRLVREASREKWVLRRIAPHLCEPLRFVFPDCEWTSWPRWKLRLGVTAYDLLCGGRNLGPSAVHRRAEMMRLLPVWPAGLRGGVSYYDAFTSDARLVLDTLTSAQKHGACLGNYTRFREAIRDENAWRVQVEDSETGEPVRISTSWIVNAAGPWGDRIRRSKAKLRLTKGIHLVMDRERLPVRSAVVMSDGPRILFVIPWGQRIIVGTTDTDYDGPLDAVRADASDVDYLLKNMNRWFSLDLERDSVRSTWAGLRPLIDRGRGGPSDISRGHRIDIAEPGWIDVAGGKLTTYRHMAAQVVDRVVEHLPGKHPLAKTDTEPLLDSSEQLDAVGVIPPEPTEELVRRFCHREWARHLDDVMIRRGGWHHYVDDPAELASRVAAWMTPLLGWSDARRAAELNRYEGLLQEAQAWRTSTGALEDAKVEHGDF